MKYIWIDDENSVRCDQICLLYKLTNIYIFNIDTQTGLETKFSAEWKSAYIL